MFNFKVNESAVRRVRFIVPNPVHIYANCLMRVPRPVELYYHVNHPTAAQEAALVKLALVQAPALERVRRPSLRQPVLS